MTVSKENRRRGVTLLLVLGLMAMFAMLVITFMIVTQQARKTAEIGAERLVGDPNDMNVVSSYLNLSVTRLLVGGLDSTIGPHSILENLYGHPDYYDNSGNKQTFLEGSFPNNLQDDKGCIYFDHDTEFSSGLNDYLLIDLIGSVITVNKLPTNPTQNQKELLGKSTFIYDVTLHGSSNIRIDFVPFKTDSQISLSDQQSALSGCGYVINSPVFSGTGPGFDKSKNIGAAALTDNNYALEPNIFSGNNSYENYLRDNLILMNPDYTAPDYRTMFLAWNDIDSSGNLQKIIPSFHRPQLVSSASPSTPDDFRKVVMRPLPHDHDDFTGGNPAATTSNFMTFLTDGPWDVDNDNDGIPDGIWLDVGLDPIIEFTTGKTYIPLVSYYIIDMDGRINVNVHGNLENVSIPPSPSGPFTDAGDVNTRGAGSGVAEISLFHLLGKDKAENIMADDSGDGRYSTDGVPGDSTKVSESDLWPDSPPSDFYEMDSMKLMGVNPFAYNFITGTTGQTKGFGGLPPDWWGLSPLFFDQLGNRYFDTNSAGDYVFANNPYLMDPYQSGIDDPFGPGELQYLLRSPSDVDFKNLPRGLRTLLDDDDADKLSNYRLQLATRSSDIPSPNRVGLATASNGSYAGLFNYIYEHIFSKDSNKTEALYNQLPREIRRGEKVNLNRLTLRENWAEPIPPLSSADHQTELTAKAKFAQEIFLLLMVLTHDQLDNGYTETNLTKNQIIERLAQWSVNLVDFIDPDNTMTPFVFHATDPLGNPDAVGTHLTSSGFFGSGWSVPANHKLIWGMEKPEMALTKTFATHNRRVADSRHDWVDPDNPLPYVSGIHEQRDPDTNPTGCPNGCGEYFGRINPSCAACLVHSNLHDTDFDQVLVPQGSLFLELYRCGDVGRQNHVNSNMYDGNQLNLAAKANGTGAYIWRLAIGEPAKTDPNTTVTASNNLFNATLGTETFQSRQSTTSTTDDPDFLGPSAIMPERFIWFGDTTPTLDSQCSYWNMGSSISGQTAVDNTKLSPNEYLVIGSRAYTSFKSKPVCDDPDKTPTANQAAQFGDPDGGPGTYVDLTDTLNSGSGTNYKPAKVMIAGNSSVAAWNGDAGNLGAQTKGIGASVSEPLPGSYYPVPQYPGASTKMGGAVNDCYYDADPANVATSTFQSEDCNTPFDQDPDRPYDVNNVDLNGFGTITGFKSIFLQRLADPNRDHDPVTNPYITVDWNVIDLHVFNSEEDANSTFTSPEPNLSYDVADGLYFMFRQWGYTAKPTTMTDRPNVWSRAFDSTAVNDTTGGLISGTTGSGTPEVAAADRSKFEWGRFANIEDKEGNDIGTTGATPSADYLGAPNRAFLHFPWNDAPFSNTYELMQVPTCAAGRFGIEFIDGETDTNWESASSVGGSGGTNDRFRNPDSAAGISSPYMNFFHTASGGTSLNLSRFFEFVRVPSRFNGTIRDWTDEATNCQPIYTMREPGKINLNTATPDAWDALKQMVANNSDVPHYATFDTLRKGSGTLPSEIGAPFRSPTSANLVPNSDQLQKPGDVTLLRESNSNPFIKPAEFSGDGSNPYTVLESVQKLSDVTTTRSNVFAVWMTLGYFEAKGTSGNASIYPVRSDGKQYEFGKEKGVDNGTAKRHRMFLFIDRSTPVGFRRGDDSLNFRDVIIQQKLLD